MVQGGGRAQRQGKRVQLQLAANASQGRAVSASTEALTTEVGAWAQIIIISPSEAPRQHAVALAPTQGRERRGDASDSF